MSLYTLLKIANALKELSSKPIQSAEQSREEVFRALTRGHCPDCQGTKFLMGPQGGLCQNIKCAKCGSEFNVAPFDDGKWCGEPFIAERINRPKKEEKP